MFLVQVGVDTLFAIKCHVTGRFFPRDQLRIVSFLAIAGSCSDMFTIQDHGKAVSEYFDQFGMFLSKFYFNIPIPIFRILRK